MLLVDVTGEGALPADAFAADLPALVERAVRAALGDRRVGEAEVSVTLMDDEAMTALNRQWKGRDATTDVLAFALHEAGEAPLGDLYIGWQQALRQAAEVGERPARELVRLAVHGTLHVLGWDHPDEGREESEMWRHQERIVDSIVIP
ncbi:MAG TPA: rRNA maturation RNase YbeY [Longimicrobiales bacterium]|nr:rRNA maturation RNase YbeY [Longimicrobiales bacterium]